MVTGASKRVSAQNLTVYQFEIDGAKMQKCKHF